MLVAAAEEDRRAVPPRRAARAGRRVGADRVDVDAVEQHLVVAADVPANEIQRVLRHHDAMIEPIGHPPQRRPQQPVPGRDAGGMERADRRCPVEQQRRHRDARRHRLVQVDHVERLVVEGADRAQRRRRVGSERGHRPVGRGRQRVAERGDEALRRRAVARSEHPRLVAPATELAGQARGPGPARHRAPSGCTG